MLNKPIIMNNESPRDQSVRDSLGGQFHFNLSIDKDGWHAQCTEI